MRAAYSLNPELAGFACLRCAAQLPIGDYFEGCPACLARGEPSSVRSIFRGKASTSASSGGVGIHRYASRLPYRSWLSLGEGTTPCPAYPELASATGAAIVFIKNEGQNPSGSHKDRMSCLAVTRALDVGARGIVAASSGNGGASVALYAAAADLECCVIATPALSFAHRHAIESTGARIVTVAESLQRWNVLAAMVRKDGWFPATNYLQPPVGSNHYGVDGLKTIAYEIVDELGAAAIDTVVVPTSRGDLIWGIYEGFRDLADAGMIPAIPRLFAVEPFPRLTRVLAGSDPADLFPGVTKLTSIGGSTVTYQALCAIRSSGGGAVVVDERQVAADRLCLAENGCYAELSSAAALTGLRQLVSDRRLGDQANAVLIVTAHGYKDEPMTDAP